MTPLQGSLLRSGLMLAATLATVISSSVLLAHRSYWAILPWAVYGPVWGLLRLAQDRKWPA